MDIWDPYFLTQVRATTVLFKTRILILDCHLGGPGGSGVSVILFGLRKHVLTMS
jgi:hypothetical protein